MRKGDLFVLSWARAANMCGGGVHSILLLPLVARCVCMAHVCFMFVVVTVWDCLLCSGRC